VPAGRYQVTWWNPVAAQAGETREIRATAEGLRLSSPEFRDDVALAVRHLPKQP